MKKIELKAIDLLNKTYEISLASVSHDGYPRVCVVSKLANEGIEKLYFSTNESSTKAEHFKINPKASICFHNGGDSVTLVGATRKIDNVAIKNSLWQNRLSKHFPGGVNDPNFCVFEFTTEKATIYIGDAFETINY